MTAALEFRHVDVFASVPFAGNGLIVLFASPAVSGAQALIALTAELRQFELIVTEFQPATGRAPARIFTAHEEPPVAGPPVIRPTAGPHRAPSHP